MAGPSGSSGTRGCGSTGGGTESAPGGRLARALGAGLLALLLASSVHALSLADVTLSVDSSSTAGSGGDSFSGTDLASESDATDPDHDATGSDGDIFLTEGDLALTDPDDLEMGGSGIDYTGPSGEWKLSDWELDIEGDPFLGAVVAVANLSDHAQTFDITLDVPVSAVTPASLLNGSTANVLDLVKGTVRNLGPSDASGDPLYEARLDGVDQGGLTELVDAPFEVTGSFLDPGHIPGDSFSGVVGPAVSDTIGIHWRFELEGKSAALFSSKLNVVAVPEPTTLGLVAIGLAGLAARGARTRARA